MLDLNPWLALTHMGSPELWLGITAGLALFYMASGRAARRSRRLRSFMKVFTLSLLVALALVLLFKGVSQIPRPCGPENPYCPGDSSLPSGHAAAAFAAFTPIALFKGRRWAPLLAVPALVAYSRLALGVHTTLDVLTGSALGLVVALASWLAVSRQEKRRGKKKV